MQLELNPALAKRQPVPAGKPSWVQIGPYEAVKVSRQDNIVTAVIEIPADADVAAELRDLRDRDGFGDDDRERVEPSAR